MLGKSKKIFSQVVVQWQFTLVQNKNSPKKQIQETKPNKSTKQTKPN